MMKKLISFFLLIPFMHAFAQEPLLTIGSHFPDIVISNIANAPVSEFYLNKQKSDKYYILNFWGTWCSPCIPEMDTLAKIQKINASNIQVIAISDDGPDRKRNYLRNKPSGIWLATDTTWTLYNMLGLSYVGQSAIVSPGKKIVALVRTDSINQQFIEKLLKGDSIKMTANIKEAAVPINDDAFGVDSNLQHSFTVRGYMKGRQTMGKRYLQGPFQGRRITWFNVSIGTLYREAFQIKSYKSQEIYDSSVSEKEIYDFENKSTLYCVDLLVKPDQKDSIYYFLGEYLNDLLPIKARLETRMMEVYILKRIDSIPLAIRPSKGDKTSFGFSGRGYDGTRVLIKDFAADYLTNEVGLPVVDETGLTGFYDIKTNVEQRDWQGLQKSIHALGFEIEKSKREMPVIVYYK